MIKPFNRRLLIDKQTKPKQENQSAFIIPSDMEEEFSKRKEFEVVKVISKSDDVTLPVKAGDKVVVLNHMIEKVELEGTEYLFITENNIIGKV
jgi:co-chaperonin GroES (HSP10)